jgi:hypothetical protein
LDALFDQLPLISSLLVLARSPDSSLTGSANRITRSVSSFPFLASFLPFFLAHALSFNRPLRPFNNQKAKSNHY